jgi:hypothetical protein
MPIRVNPVHRLKRCRLSLRSIQQICNRVTSTFPDAKFNASDDIWEVFDEGEEAFLAAISSRKRLDSERVEAQSREPRRKLDLIFDQAQATITFVADEDQAEWFKHFRNDVEEYIRPATIAQSPVAARLMSAAMPSAKPIPYTSLAIQDSPSNPMLENIKGGLATNAVWLLLGIALTLIWNWLSGRLGLGGSPLDFFSNVPSTPTP